MQLRGMEALTLEIPGRMPIETARRFAGDLPIRTVDGAAAMELLLFRMRNLRMNGRPPGVDYGEALWRVGVTIDGQPAWLGALWQIDHPAMVLAAQLMWRAPVERASFAFADGDPASISIAGRAPLAVHAFAGEESPPAEPPLRCVYRRGAHVYEVPWAEEAAPFRRRARVEVRERQLVEATLGPGVRFADVGVLHRGRTHRCQSVVRLERQHRDHGDSLGDDAVSPAR